MTFILGVDGGTSKTKALLAAPDGTIAGYGHAGGSNIYDGDPQRALENGLQAAELAVTSAGISPDQIATSVFSMSGADWPEDMLYFRAGARARSLGQQIVVVNDAMGGMRAGLPGPDAVGIVCGTGAGCAARSHTGRQWHAGFWQQGGGASELSRAALQAIYRAELGADQETALAGQILQRFGEKSVPALLHRQTALMHEPLPDIPLLASLVLDVAAAGDTVAQTIVRDQARGLAETAMAAARQVGIDGQPYDLVLAGSLFRHPSTILPDAIVKSMREFQQQVTVLRSRHEPVVGALLLALEEHGTTVNQPVISRIISTLPEGWY